MIPAADLAARAEIALAVRLLPAGPVRDRYRQEFSAELPFLPPGERPAFALRLLVSTPSLRAVTHDRRHAISKDRTMSHYYSYFYGHGPVSCRLNLFHSWRTRSTEDGGLYLQCHWCGRDRTGDDRPTWNYRYHLR